jgi:hypothetical protein
MHLLVRAFWRLDALLLRVKDSLDRWIERTEERLSRISIEPMLRILALFLGIAVLVTCSTMTRNTLTSNEPPRRYEINSASWETATVYIYCQGQQKAVEHQINTGETRRGNIKANGCLDFSFRITLLANRDTYNANVLGWTPGTTLRINVLNHLPLTNFVVR